MDKKTIVISGVNLVDGGPLSVFLDLLDTVVDCGYSKQNKIIALVGKKELFEKYEGEIKLVEYRRSKNNWIYRLYYEFVGFKAFSKHLDVDVWLSMHDITPNVIAKHRYVYCHNPSPFNEMTLSDARFGIKYYLFSKFYKYLYKINIKKNDAVIVQQNWMRKEFCKMYKLPNEKVIVSRPNLPNVGHFMDKSNKEEFISVFPSFPRYYKNFQVACEASRIISKTSKNFKLYITLSGNENAYSKWLLNKYGNDKNIVFCGLLSRKKLFELYERSNCMLFMSKLETWGMPITEYKVTGKPLVVADLPYAHETVGDYDKVAFISTDDATKLAEAIKKIIKSKDIGKSVSTSVEKPYAKGWDELLRMIFC